MTNKLNNDLESKATISMLKRLAGREEENTDYHLTDEQIKASYELVVEMQHHYAASDTAGFKRAALRYEDLHREILKNGQKDDGQKEDPSGKAA